MLDIEILDLGVNNLKSLRSSLEGITKGKVSVIDQSSQSTGAPLLVLPGVGAYGAAMDRFVSRGFRDLIEVHNEAKKPIFGICLGMQLLGNASDESPQVSGLGLVPGEVRLLPTSGTNRVPNVGWLDVKVREDCQSQFGGISGHDFYFIHSYYFSPTDPESSFLFANHGSMEFTAGVLNQNVMGVQFHPEKSSNFGTKFLSQVIDWANA